DGLADDDLERRVPHRRSDAQFGKRAMEAREMRRLVDEVPAIDRDHLINPVGELEAAILDMHRRLAMRQVLAGDIGDARHDRSVSFSGKAKTAIASFDDFVSASE